MWTPEEESQLRKLWGSGLTASKIGEKLGKSKNGVIGKANRIGLEKRPHIIQGYYEKRKAGSPTMMELGPRDCRYPLGEKKEPATHYCGKEVKPGSPYCPTHTKIAYRKIERKRQ